MKNFLKFFIILIDKFLYYDIYVMKRKNSSAVFATLVKVRGAFGAESCRGFEHSFNRKERKR